MVLRWRPSSSSVALQTHALSAFMDDKQNQTLIDYELLMKKSDGQESKAVRAAALGPLCW